jgi:hypothetical protein
MPQGSRDVTVAHLLIEWPRALSEPLPLESALRAGSFPSSAAAMHWLA